ncbi:ParB/RepB/Spo0J family partition protein [Kocuria rosea]|uniref:ParB/RepB/Spo0J family partition protein n=1 Tax=Kocuria rosea TaxID=1275 RepID=UPI002041C093|nr:ParB/RepB/Spo0J family partition protein [Kocuria rosea]MCM3688497.1 ParB/RepB/Spo0J family partition protein [Kocuria rosea]
MGEALRNTTLVSRPSDMFFLPSVPDPDTGQQDSTGPDVPRETEAPTSPEPAGTPTAPTGPAAAARPDRAAPAPSTTDSPTAESATPAVAPPADPPAPAAAEPSAEAVSRETTTGTRSLATVPGATFAELPVASIHPNRKQPRQVFDEEELAELAYSIGELGVLQPIVVRSSREGGDKQYELVMGERRWRATQRAGLATIPAIVRETSDDDLLRDALLENLHRSQLNPLEEAAAYQQLLEEFGATQEELARRIGRSRPQISNTIRLLKLPPLVQRRVAAGVLSAGHARALLALADPAEMERLAQRIVAEGLSVRATEEAVALFDRSKKAPERVPAAAPRHQERLDYIAEAFADRLDTSVKIALGARKGRMTIEFASVEDLNRIIEVLDPGMDRS